jgi:hypothetical protein
MILHILNGDCTRMILERTGLPGETLVWADVLHEGPAPARLSDAAWQDVRARFHAADPAEGDDEGPHIDVGAQLRAADARLARYREYDEVVFWLEHDLFDQLLLIRHLAWLASLAPQSGAGKAAGRHVAVPADLHRSVCRSSAVQRTRRAESHRTRVSFPEPAAHYA